MNISGINFESITDGEGVRVVIYVSGCNHNCEGCHNPSTHPFDSGKPFTIELQNQIIEYIKQTPFISGITFSGGDPMGSYTEVLSYIRFLKLSIPDINIWLYTGYTIEQIKKDKGMNEILKYINVLVDGKFVKSLKDTTLSFRGSSNQRIIKLR